MFETWTSWLAALAAQTEIDSIVQLGAGDGMALESLLHSPAQRIVLVEPDPDMAADLRRRAQRDARVRVVSAAVDAQSGEATLHRLSLAGQSSLRTPGDLRDLFPGLRSLDAMQVETLDLPGLVKRVGLAPAAAQAVHVLRIDAPGSEHAIAAQLAALPVEFAYVALRVPAHPLYDAAPAAGAVLEVLQEQGYRVEARQTDDPDFPEYWLHRDLTARRLAEAEALTASQQALTASQQARIKALEAEVIELRKVRSSQTDEAREQTTMALRMQTLQAADLADLQGRYAKLLEEKLHQDALLAQVTARLARLGDEMRAQETARAEADKAARETAKAPAESPAKDAAKPADKTADKTGSKSAGKAGTSDKTGAA